MSGRSSEITREQVDTFGRGMLSFMFPDDVPILLALIAAWEREQETCKWTWNTDGFYGSACGKSWMFETGDCAENGMVYCHGCGRRIEEVKEATHADQD